MVVAPWAQANVFASNVQLGGTTTNLMTSAGASVSISYLLNQHADAGVTVAVVAGTNVLWSTNLTATGTNRGVNSVVWTGKAYNGNTPTSGLWSVKVTAASAGKTNWSKVPMNDNGYPYDGDGYSWAPFGIGVNNNHHSPYFGRIFVGNAYQESPADLPGKFRGILKYNADGSYGSEGARSTGGWNWNPANSDDPEAQGPSKIEVGADDRVYVLDRIDHSATVLSLDQILSTNPPLVLALDHDSLLPAPTSFSGLFVTGAGTNRELFAADSAGGLGIRRWLLDSNGVAPANDPGVTRVNAGGSSSLNGAPEDLTLDASRRIYAIQRLPAGGSSARILSFPPYQGSPLTNASWTVAGNAQNAGLVDAVGIAAALHTNYLAVVCRSAPQMPITVYRVTPTNATLITAPGDGLNSGDYREYTDVTWDRAGNLYVTDWAYAAWQVFSPPGGNHFTTTALQTIKIGAYVTPALTAVGWNSNQFQVQLAGEPGLSYIIESSTNLISWSGVATNQAQASLNLWNIPSVSPKAFFRARLMP